MRRLHALIVGLPPQSALAREVLGDAWTNETALLALIADRLGVVATAGKYGLRSVPDPIPRPAGATRPKVAADAATIQAFFGMGGSA